METINTKQFILDARGRLQGKDARRMAAFHTGVAAAAALVVTLLQYALEQGIGNTAGLSGMGTRAILQTVQTVLQWANTILAPFWNLGFVYVALLWARDQYARKEDLLTGFHRIGPCIGLLVTRLILTFSVVVICANVCSAIYMSLPVSEELWKLMPQVETVDAMYAYMDQMTPEQYTQMLYAMLPVLVLCLVLSVALLVPLLYRFRLAEYAVLNQKGVRAMPAMIISAVLMRRRCWQLFKLDLRFWWYYGLKILCMLLCNLDLLLRTAGVTLPVGGDGAFFGSYVLYLAAWLAVETAFRPLVQTAYAGVYEAFVAAGPVQRKQVSAPAKNVPWDEQ